MSGANKPGTNPDAKEAPATPTAIPASPTGVMGVPITSEKDGLLEKNAERSDSELDTATKNAIEKAIDSNEPRVLYDLLASWKEDKLKEVENYIRARFVALRTGISAQDVQKEHMLTQFNALNLSSLPRKEYIELLELMLRTPRYINNTEGNKERFGHLVQQAQATRTGRIVAGIILALIGAVLIASAAMLLASSFGAATPLLALAVTMGTALAQATSVVGMVAGVASGFLSGYSFYSRKPASNKVAFYAEQLTKEGSNREAKGTLKAEKSVPPGGLGAGVDFFEALNAAAPAQPAGNPSAASATPKTPK